MSCVVSPGIFIPAKWYKVSKWHVLVDTFDRKAITWKMYQQYKAKDMWLSRAAGSKASCHGCQSTKHCAAHNRRHFTKQFNSSGERISLWRLLKNPVLSNPLQLKALSPNTENYKGAWTFGIVYSMFTQCSYSCLLMSCWPLSDVLPFRQDSVQHSVSNMHVLNGISNWTVFIAVYHRTHTFTNYPIPEECSEVVVDTEQEERYTQSKQNNLI